MIKNEKHKKIVELYEQGNTVREIAKLLNIGNGGVTYVLKKYNINTNKKYDKRKIKPEDDNIFEDINTEYKAYWLGFLMADGYINDKRNYISLNIKDLDILEEYRNFIGGNCYIETTKENLYYRVRVTSEKMIKDLEKHGCINNKSLILKYPTTIPDNLQYHFIRGYFDGDGSISFSNNTQQYSTSFTGTEEFLTNIKEKLNLSSKANLRKQNKVYRYEIKGNKKVKELGDKLYKDATIYLKRKKDKFDKLN